MQWDIQILTKSIIISWNLKISETWKLKAWKPPEFFFLFLWKALSERQKLYSTVHIHKDIKRDYKSESLICKLGVKLGVKKVESATFNILTPQLHILICSEPESQRDRIGTPHCWGCNKTLAFSANHLSGLLPVGPNNDNATSSSSVDRSRSRQVSRAKRPGSSVSPVWASFAPLQRPKSQKNTWKWWKMDLHVNSEK